MHLHVENELSYLQNYSLLLDLEARCNTVGTALRWIGVI